MSVFKLEGDIARLRKAAKACADGSLSRVDYRHYRTKVIENLSNAKEGSKGATDEPLDDDLLASDSPLRMLAIVGLGALVAFAAFVAYLIYVG